jgi:hypothetical protein
LLPVADFVELCVSVVYLVLGFTLQDTYIGHLTILVGLNIVPSLAKLIACLPMLTIGAPNPRTKLISVWPLKLYFWVRVLSLGLLLWLIIVNASLSTYAIANQNFYNNFDYGMCSFCYVKKSCMTSYTSYIDSLNSTGAASFKYLSDKSNITFAQYAHRNVTS